MAYWWHSVKKIKFTNRSVQDFLRHSDIGQRLYDTEAAGFHIRNLKSGGFFYLKYRNHIGKWRVLPIGKYTENTIDQARDKAKKCIGRIIEGEDIQETLKEEKAAHSKTARDYLESAYRAVQARKKTGYGTLLSIENFLFKKITSCHIALSY